MPYLDDKSILLLCTPKRAESFSLLFGIMTLKIKNISKLTNRQWILKEIGFEVKRGEIFGVFGLDENELQNLLEIIAGGERSNGGEIFFGEKEISNLSADKRNFHTFFEKKESFLGSIFKTDKSAKKQSEKLSKEFDNVLERSEEVLLLDNQFCFLDPEKRRAKISLLRKKVREKGLHVIFTTNNFEEIFLVCDRVAIIHLGRVFQMGTPREIYEGPENVVVARQTGRNNLITARRITSTKIDSPEFQTIVGDHRLFTAKLEKSKLGAINQNITLAIRPEHISISFGASFPEDNLLKAKINEINYLGATTLIKLDANGLELEALVLRLVGLNIGDECVVGLPPDRINILKN